MMLLNRKNQTSSKPSKLKKTNTLKYNQTIKKNTNKQKNQTILTQQTENINNRSNSLKNNKLQHHFASSTFLLYSPFRKDYYLPPHLDSKQMFIEIYTVKVTFLVGKIKNGKYDQHLHKSMTTIDSTLLTSTNMK